MRRTLLLIASVLLLVTLVGACESKTEAVDKAKKSGKLAPKPFCQAAYNFDEAVATAKNSKRLALLTIVVDRAPAGVKPEAQMFLEGFKRADRGEEITDVERKRYERASNAVERFANDKCGLFQQNQPPGGGI